MEEARVGEVLGLLEERGWSLRRMVGLTHVLAAVELGCHGVAAVGRLVARRGGEYGLDPVNRLRECS